MNRNEILRYLRTNIQVKDEQLDLMIEEAMTEVNQTVRPKNIYKIFDAKIDDQKITIENMCFKSSKLAENLKGCKQLAILAVTLGTEGDRLLRKYSSESASLVIMQAVLASKVEEICDKVQNDIEKQFNVKTRQRFSPGYYDLDISEQKKIFQLLDITKRCSIVLTDSYQMIPTKSVTAFTGIDYEY